MDEAKREARRKQLAELEGSWESVAEPLKPPSPEVEAALDAAADRLVESLHEDRVSLAEPNLDELDSGWGEDEDDEEEEEEPEPDLPDERLDPVAYAAAKKARDERIEARRERKRVKGEAKKARRRARAEAAKGKQKGKSRKARSPASVQSAKVAQAKARAELQRRGPPKRAAVGDETIENEVNEDESESDAATSRTVASARPPAARAKAPPSRVIGSKPMLSATNTWMLAIALVVFVAAAIFAAVVTR